MVLLYLDHSLYLLEIKSSLYQKVVHRFLVLLFRADCEETA